VLTSEKRFKRVYVEIGNICNLQCSFCPEVDRSKFRLEAQAFRKTLEQVKPFADMVCFHVMGEPLAHPEFARFVQIAGELELPVEITTNGTLLNEKIEEALFHPIVRQVNFSLQSFFDNFPRANAETYLGNIFAFCQKAFVARPDLYLNFRLWNLTDEKIHDGTNLLILEKIEEEFKTKINHQVDPAFRKSKNVVNRLYLHFDSRFEWPNPEHPIASEKGRCHGTVSHIAVHADGTVVPCCLDKEANIPLGKLSESSFSEIIVNPRTTSMFEGFKKGELREDLCKRCTYIQRFS
jgi:radical SAM protein with 4Fe4S-binding SPASM domain